jgi:hypothetical protein
VNFGFLFIIPPFVFCVVRETDSLLCWTVLATFQYKLRNKLLFYKKKKVKAGTVLSGITPIRRCPSFSVWVKGCKKLQVPDHTSTLERNGLCCELSLSFFLSFFPIRIWDSFKLPPIVIVVQFKTLCRSSMGPWGTYRRCRPSNRKIESGRCIITGVS